MEASDSSPTSLRLFVTDRNSKKGFLVDTGADLCVYPRTFLRGPREKSTYELLAANNSVIATYGTITITLDLGLRRAYTWRFVIADVPKPIIGADFLAFYGLLVDVRGRRLVDQLTSLTAKGHVAKGNLPGVKTIAGTSIYHEQLQSFLKSRARAAPLLSRNIRPNITSERHQAPPWRISRGVCRRRNCARPGRNSRP